MSAWRAAAPPTNFSNFDSLKSTETREPRDSGDFVPENFSNFDSLKSTETILIIPETPRVFDFSNFDSLKSTETAPVAAQRRSARLFQQFRLVEEY